MPPRSRLEILVLALVTATACLAAPAAAQPTTAAEPKAAKPAATARAAEAVVPKAVTEEDKGPLAQLEWRSVGPVNMSGRVADVVGKTLRRLGEQFQVLCITHLPQIAAAGHVHFQISKAVVDGRTQTRVVRLSAAERVEEVARMIGGAAQTDAARAAARELLGESETKSKGESERAKSRGVGKGR